MAKKITVYNVSIPIGLLYQAGLKNLTYSSIEEAINATMNGLKGIGKKFEIRHHSNKVSFISEGGGELATIIQA